MAKMKKFLIYFLIFIGIYLFVEIFTNLQMKENFQDVTNHEISITSPKVDIAESKASSNSGYIKGTITNDTGKHIRDKYLQFDFYDKDGVYLGTESQQIKYFNVDEKVSFDIPYKYKDVNKIKIGFVDEIIKPYNKDYNFFNLNDKEKALILPALLVVYIIVS